MKQSIGRLKLANHASQKGIIALWSEPKWSRHCTDLVYAHYLNAPLLFILYVLLHQSSVKAEAEFPFPWKHLTLPRLTALFKRTEMSLNILPSSRPFPLPAVSLHPTLQLLSSPVLQQHPNCSTDGSRALNWGLGNSQLYFDLWNVNGWETLGASSFPSNFELSEYVVIASPSTRSLLFFLIDVKMVI